MLAARTLFFVVIMVLFQPPGFSAAPWIQRDVTDDGITVYSRESGHENLREFFAECRINNSAYKVFLSAMSRETYNELNKYLVEYKIMKTADPSLWYSYQRVSFPVIKDRDYTLRLKSKVNPLSGEHAISWVIDNDQGPPPQNDVVRVTLSKGAVTMTPEKDGEHCLLTYQIMFDPGGAVPKWLVNYANKRALPDIIRVIRKNSYHQKEQ
jgi:hypothetical protein